MLKKVIKYKDYFGEDKEDTLYFNLDPSELMEMEMETTGGLSKMIEKIIAEEDNAKIISMFKEIILKSYGKISDDGRRFIKTQELRDEFAQTKAYSTLFMELAQDAEAANAFTEGVMDVDTSATPALQAVKKQNNPIPAPPAK